MLLTRPTRPTRRMHPMRPAATDNQTSVVELAVDFDSSIQTLGALEAAAYRLIGRASCKIERVDDRFVCHLTAQFPARRGEQMDASSLKDQFLNLVADENLRARVAEKTQGVRNVILALAFGSLAAAPNEPN
jgi:His-Xaa-Ser system protein HxsD